MHRTVLGTALLASIATSSPQERAAPGPIVVPVARPPAPVAVRRYVSASSLNLRSEPSSSGAVEAKLSINTEVRQEKVQGEWARVTTTRGQQGWVGVEFLEEARLTYEAAARRAARADTPEDALAWAQRAAALHPVDVDALKQLEIAYRALDRGAEADIVRSRIGELGGSRFEAWFPAALRADLAAYRTELAQVSTLEQFVAARRRGLELSSQVSQVLDGVWDDEAGDFAGTNDLGWLKPELPGLQIDWGPEGIGAHTNLALDPFAEAASRTPSTEDDLFVAFLRISHDNFEAIGWPAWHQRDWDYGGCNTLGDGLHLKSLLGSDALLGSEAFAKEVAALRARVIQDIVEDDTEFFPYCETTGKPTAPAVLEGELTSILAQVKLSAEERTLLEARQKRGWPNNP